MAQKTAAKAAGTAAPEAEYSAKELVSAARSKFGVSPDIMAAALKTAGPVSYTHLTLPTN